MIIKNVYCNDSIYSTLHKVDADVIINENNGYSLIRVTMRRRVNNKGS